MRRTAAVALLLAGGASAQQVEPKPFSLFEVAAQLVEQGSKYVLDLTAKFTQETFQEDADSQGSSGAPSSVEPWHGPHGPHGPPPGPYRFWMKMQQAHECHEKCGLDAACHQQCPKPWKHMEKMCGELKDIKACVEGCADKGADCKEKCPSFSVPWLQQMVGRCPMKMAIMEGKCIKLAEIGTCHKSCSHLDVECHHKCPKMTEVFAHGHGPEGMHGPWGHFWHRGGEGEGAPEGHGRFGPWGHFGHGGGEGEGAPEGRGPFGWGFWHRSEHHEHDEHHGEQGWHHHGASGEHHHGEHHHGEHHHGEHHHGEHHHGEHYHGEHHHGGHWHGHGPDAEVESIHV